ncbi:hypothetical protein ACFRFL_07905 [Streptomyces sp. NPDC056708]|uniref:hypothetical protein n=1 Tax=unclassified Streptomyces TaxID=2593676 RepID=UPI0036C076AC
MRPALISGVVAALAVAALVSTALAAPNATAAPARADCTAPTGPYQRPMEPGPGAAALIAGAAQVPRRAPSAQ